MTDMGIHGSNSDNYRAAGRAAPSCSSPNFCLIDTGAELLRVAVSGGFVLDALGIKRWKEVRFRQASAVRL